MRLFIFIVLFSLTLISKGFAQSRQFNFLEMQEYFRAHFAPDFESQGYFRWEKRNKDWYLVACNVEEGKLIDVVKTKVLSDGKFLATIEHYKSIEGDGLDYHYSNANNDTMSYRLHRYYGYSGWYNDVIAYFDEHKPQRADDWYSKGRAYSTRANACLSNQYGDAVNSENMNLAYTLNSMSQLQIDEYVGFSKKAQECFKLVLEKDPAYNTIVGNIALKYANEVVVTFHGLLTYANDAALKCTLPEKLYPDTVLLKARAVLSLCPQNAILISYGDMDFYPILYVQHKEKLRRDVYLTNSSLLGMDRYIFRTQFAQFDAKPIKLDIDSSLYMGNVNNYLLNDQSEEIMTMAELTAAIKENKNNQTSIKGRTLKITSRSNPQKHILSAKGSFLFKNEIIFCSILQNLGDRIIVSQSQFADELAGFNDAFVNKDGLFMFKW